MVFTIRTPGGWTSRPGIDTVSVTNQSVSHTAYLGSVPAGTYTIEWGCERQAGATSGLSVYWGNLVATAYAS